jgi:hypothetical protein
MSTDSAIFTFFDDEINCCIADSISTEGLVTLFSVLFKVEEEFDVLLICAAAELAEAAIIIDTAIIITIPK